MSEQNIDYDFPMLVKDGWCKQEVLLLIKLLNEHRGDFRKVGEEMRRSARECRKKWSSDLRHLTTFPVRPRS
ncbi:125_t:CDS:2 [Acaulospora morrowiae]|uniref:125_t:CDS:1 n=1 Tax=Acaulospora morrowiae TaxID=94023 RepID=A0A9N8W8A6_9GLOM|nr:125_t:CDS:2 [Acaulospora morrowiae]